MANASESDGTLVLDTSISSGRQRLPDRIERVGNTGGYSVIGYLLFALPFLLGGGLAMLGGTGVLKVTSRGNTPPLWVLFTMGVTFALVGCFVLGLAWRQHGNQQRAMKVTGKGAAGRALKDYAWDPTGTQSRLWFRAGLSSALALFLTLFMMPFNYWLWAVRDSTFVAIVIGFFDVVVLALLWSAAILVGRALKFGASRVTFKRFPLDSNEGIVLEWHSPTGVRRARAGSFTLRCIEESIEFTQSGNERSQKVVHDSLWQQAWKLAGPRRFAPHQPVHLRFGPAQGGHPTRIHGHQPVYWELEVKLDLPGLDFVETYLVPIY